jgi:hypothetical protein
MMLAVSANSWQNKIFLQYIFKFVASNLSSFTTTDSKSDDQYDPRTK